MTPEEYLAGHPLAQAVFLRIKAVLEGLGPVEVRASKSQIAFRRRRGFAYLWMPGQYLSRPQAEQVLSIALGRHVESERFKEVAHPSAKHWMHHLEITDVEQIDSEVVDWLAEAADRAT